MCIDLSYLLYFVCVFKYILILNYKLYFINYCYDEIIYRKCRHNIDDNKILINIFTFTLLFNTIL